MGIGFSYSRLFITLSAAFAYYGRNGATTVGNLPFSPLGMESWTHAKVLSASSSNDVVCAAAMHSFNFSEYGNMTGNNASHRSQRSQATDLGKAFTRYVT
jgi:hypothetical protein